MLLQFCEVGGAINKLSHGAGALITNYGPGSLLFDPRVEEIFIENSHGITVCDKK
jgi:hypothetical protein